MNQKKLVVIFMALALPAVALFAVSSFQNTCSNIKFIYEGNSPVLSATCLRKNGTVKPSKLVLQGISNQNGRLVKRTGESTFQKSCGNIRIEVAGSTSVILTALCRKTDGSSIPAKLPLDGISNQDGTLTE